jgi:hypothetical protein
MKKRTSHESVKVIAHERRKPAKNATGPVQSIAQRASDQLADNVLMGEMPNRGVTSGLRGPGEGDVNHLAASIGLLNRRRV